MTSTPDPATPDPVTPDPVPVSVIMPVLNEERHLAESLASVLGQDHPGPLEVILALGPSRDATDEVAARFAADPRVLTVANPSGRTPSALNAALTRATGEVVVRLDAHAVIAPDYVRTAVATLARTGAVNVGGIMAAAGRQPWPQAVAVAMTSPLGVGAAPHHVGGAAGPAETVYLGVYRRSALTEVGGFDERFLRAQDWEVNYRLRQAGGLVWFTPQLQVTYRPRDTIGGLARQYHGYGRWRRAVAREHGTTSLRYLAAPLTVVGLIAGGALLIVGVGVLGVGVLGVGGATAGPAGATAGPAGWVAAGLLAIGVLPLLGYAGLVLAGGGWISRREGWRVRVRTPLALAVMHLSWGWGYLTSPRGLPERTLRSR